MLRNGLQGVQCFRFGVLNEVLSLNAQELARVSKHARTRYFLNEVLSLNAQEFQAHR